VRIYELRGDKFLWNLTRSPRESSECTLERLTPEQEKENYEPEADDREADDREKKRRKKKPVKVCEKTDDVPPTLRRPHYNRPIYLDKELHNLAFQLKTTLSYAAEVKSSGALEEALMEMF
jgi:hypothetical protein